MRNTQLWRFHCSIYLVGTLYYAFVDIEEWKLTHPKLGWQFLIANAEQLIWDLLEEHNVQVNRNMLMWNLAQIMDFDS